MVSLLNCGSGFRYFAHSIIRVLMWSGFAFLVSVMDLVFFSDRSIFGDFVSCSLFWKKICKKSCFFCYSFRKWRDTHILISISKLLASYFQGYATAWNNCLSILQVMARNPLERKSWRRLCRILANNILKHSPPHQQKSTN